MLRIIGYSTMPGSAASNIEISNSATGNPALQMAQLGDGFTWSDSFPLYLEGFIGAARYDPTFVFQDGNQTQPISVKWNSIAANGGIGWDFKIADHWVLRPIVTVSLGYIASDAHLFGLLLKDRTNIDIKFLHTGTMNSAGGGGSMVLGYYIREPRREIDVEFRGTSSFLTNWGHSAATVKGHANVEAVSGWERYRWPTGLELFGRPIRYVVQSQQTQFIGPESKELGFNSLFSVGGGLETDPGGLKIGAFGLYVERVRVTANYYFGPNVSGWSVGLGISF